MSAIDLRLGRWEDVLQDVEPDLLCTDPPYGARTHAGQRHGRKDPRYCDPSVNPLLSARGIEYTPWDANDVDAFVDFWAPKTRGWFAAFTSHDLVSAYMSALELNGRYVFAPIACVQHAMNVRLAGDGPSNWTTWLVVSRPTSLRHWGTLPGAYTGSSHDEGENALDRSKRAVPGGKPLWLMRAIVRDYSRPGDLVADPCSGGATTLLAAAMEGRRAVGAEMDVTTHAKAMARLAKGYTAPLFVDERKPAQQMSIDDVTEHERDEAPYVCPGCYSIAGPCLPGCIDAEIAADVESDREAFDYELDAEQYDDDTETTR
jgi:site-specific DNA-methyltransferase (adenine-specific)